MIGDYQKIILKPKKFFKNIKNGQSNFFHLCIHSYTHILRVPRATILSATIIRSKNKIICIHFNRKQKKERKNKMLDATSCFLPPWLSTVKYMNPAMTNFFFVYRKNQNPNQRTKLNNISFHKKNV